MIVIGPKPTASPSLQNWPASDKEVQALAAQLWDKGAWGKGEVYPAGTDLKQVLDKLGIKPDCYVDLSKPFGFIHRQMPNRDIYFVSNQSDQAQDLQPVFRVTGRKAELWNPVTAERMRMDLQDKDSLSTLNLHLEGNESAFIVFSEQADETLSVYSPAEKQTLLTIDTPWKVTFQKGMRGPEEECKMSNLLPWNQSGDECIRYFSGTATYTNTFRLKKQPEQPVWLDLGRVMVMARVYVNDQYVGGVWTAPYRLNIQHLLREGINSLRVEVVNNWQNRLIGDQRLSAQERLTWTSVNPWHADSPLQESGLIGPVRLLQDSYTGK